MELALECARDHGGRPEPAREEGGRAPRPRRGGAAFLDAPYLRDSLISLGVLSDTFETAITWERFGEFHSRVSEAARRAVAEASGVPREGEGSPRVMCRFTHVYPDGPAPYYTVLAPARRGSEVEQWDEVKAAASEAIVSAGGTITHHHAVGRDHRPWYDLQRPDRVRRGARRRPSAPGPRGHPQSRGADRSGRAARAPVGFLAGEPALPRRSLVDLTLNESETAFRDEVRSWLEENHPGEEPPGDDEAFEFRRDWQKKMHEAGWAGISWPKEYGGRGATLIEQAIFAEEMARAEAPAPANVLGLVMGGPVIIAHGTDEQKERWLEPDPHRRGDLVPGLLGARVRLRPRLAEDAARSRTNGDWRVTGQKVWTTFAHESKWCMLVARTDSEARPSTRA